MQTPALCVRCGGVACLGPSWAGESCVAAVLDLFGWHHRNAWEEERVALQHQHDALERNVALQEQLLAGEREKSGLLAKVMPRDGPSLHHHLSRWPPPHHPLSLDRRG
jgi:hypothetical protein